MSSLMKEASLAEEECLYSVLNHDIFRYTFAEPSGLRRIASVVA